MKKEIEALSELEDYIFTSENVEEASLPPLPPFSPSPVSTLAISTPKLYKEIFILNESQSEILKYFYDSLPMYESDFIYYEEGSGSYKTLSTLRENLFDTPYWLISIFDKKNIDPPIKYKYDSKVLKQYLNHIIITYDWGLLDRMEDDYSIKIKFGDLEFVYKIKFISNLAFSVYENYINSKLSGVSISEEVRNYILEDKKRIVQNVNKLLSLNLNIKGIFERYINDLKMHKDNTSIIDDLIKNLALRNKKFNYSKCILALSETYNGAYISKVLKNNVNTLFKAKKNIKDAKYRKYSNYADKIDLFNLYVLNCIVNKSDWTEVLIGLEMYISKDLRNLIKEGKLS